MAIAVIGGLFSSTVLSLVLVPVVHEFVDGFEDWLKPKLKRITTPKVVGDDAPVTPEDETLAPDAAAAREAAGFASPDLTRIPAQ